MRCDIGIRAPLSFEDGDPSSDLGVMLRPPDFFKITSGRVFDELRRVCIPDYSNDSPEQSV